MTDKTDDVKLLRSVGYFDEPGQTKPAFDPGEKGICPLCDEEIGASPRLCRSLMPVSGRRSYFFSYHAACRDDARLEEIEGRVVDHLFDWEAAQ